MTPMPDTPAPQSRAIASVDDLLQARLAPPDARAGLEAVAQEFRIRLTPEMHAAIAPDTPPADPVARQFVPDARELQIRPEELHDPIGDATHSPVPGLTHRYPDRVIVHLTQTCAVYCRFCFRRETVGADGALPEAELQAALDYIAARPAIFEVILTGGDPLVLSARRLDDVMRRLCAIPHLGVVRVHSRVPVVAPERITPALIGALKRHPASHVVVHTNHAQELTGAARAALGRLVDAGIPLLSQSVLLRGVNDDADTLEALFRALIALRVKPYYLHHCDLARGTGHFRTTIAEGQAIMERLRMRLSGLALPSYVIDIPGGYGKVPIGPDYVQPETEPGAHLLRDPRGQTHRYRDPAR